MEHPGARSRRSRGAGSADGPTACGERRQAGRRVWRRSLDELRRSRPRLTVKLRTDPGSARTLATWQETSIAGHDDPTDPESRVTLWTDFEDEEHARFVLLGLGARAEVLEPASLRKRVREEMQAALELWK